MVNLSTFCCFSSPANMGLLDPSTSDGRVIFFLPWEHSTMAGLFVISYLAFVFVMYVLLGCLSTLADTHFHVLVILLLMVLVM